MIVWTNRREKACMTSIWCCDKGDSVLRLIFAQQHSSLTAFALPEQATSAPISSCSTTCCIICIRSAKPAQLRPAKTGLKGLYCRSLDFVSQYEDHPLVSFLQTLQTSHSCYSLRHRPLATWLAAPRRLRRIIRMNSCQYFSLPQRPQRSSS